MMRLFSKKVRPENAEPSITEAASSVKELDEPVQNQSTVVKHKESADLNELGESAYRSEGAIDTSAMSKPSDTKQLGATLDEEARPDNAKMQTTALDKKSGLGTKFTGLLDFAKLKFQGMRNQPTDDFTQLPIRIIIGYLPEVNERDAREYAQGMAEKHFEQMGIAYFDAYEYGNGYAFEAHEGGNGRAYLPQILERFEALGPYRVGETNAVVIKTATRLVEVQRVRDGLAAILLPEASQTEPTEDLKPTTRMVPGLNRLTAFFYSGVVLMASGTLAMLLSGTIFRVQTFKDAPPQKIEKVQINNLPRAQWNKIESLPPGSYVRAIRYRNNKWEAPEIVTDAPAPPVAPADAVKAPGEEVKK